jgi:hypothetical protein
MNKVPRRRAGHPTRFHGIALCKPAGARIASPQRGMKNALGFAQDGQQGVMAFTPWALRVVAFCGALLAATALEDGGVKIKAKALVRCGEVAQEPAPKGALERLDGALGSAFALPTSLSDRPMSPNSIWVSAGPVLHRQTGVGYEHGPLVLVRQGRLSGSGASFSRAGRTFAPPSSGGKHRGKFKNNCLWAS